MTVHKKHLKIFSIMAGGLGVVAFAGFTLIPIAAETRYERSANVANTTQPIAEVVVPVKPPEPPKPIVTHIDKPEMIKAVYMSSWVGGTTKFRQQIVDLIDRTEVNTLVLDIKDYSGKIAFHVDNKLINDVGSTENRIPDAREFINYLHEKNIYVIGRVTVFQDPVFANARPAEAVKKVSAPTEAWRDKSGLKWLDAGSKVVWDYVAEIGKVAYKDFGFDEINYDYIRFPSDGNMKDVLYPYSQGKVKSEVIESFYTYLGETMHKENIPISADLFGMVTTNTDDLGIGQVLEKALPHFDHIYPMVYPSHFPPGWNGYANMHAHAYDVIYTSMNRAKVRAEAMGQSSDKLCPWLQDFNLYGAYTPDKVRDQIKATYDAGLSCWLLWDSANTYTESALLPK